MLYKAMLVQHEVPAVIVKLCDELAGMIALRRLLPQSAAQKDLAGGSGD